MAPAMGRNCRMKNVCRITVTVACSTCSHNYNTLRLPLLSFLSLQPKNPSGDRRNKNLLIVSQLYVYLHMYMCVACARTHVAENSRGLNESCFCGFCKAMNNFHSLCIQTVCFRLATFHENLNVFERASVRLYMYCECQPCFYLVCVPTYMFTLLSLFLPGCRFDDQPRTYGLWPPPSLHCPDNVHRPTKCFLPTRLR